MSLINDCIYFLGWVPDGKVVQMLTNVLCVIKIPKILIGRKLQVVVLFDKRSATIIWSYLFANVW